MTRLLVEAEQIPGGLTTNPSEVWMNTWVDIAEPVYAFAASHNAFVSFEATLEPM